ncbi:WD repeat and HMG-box DNA binding-domain containing protein 1 [Sparganum proliferum]
MVLHGEMTRMEESYYRQFKKGEHVIVATEGSHIYLQQINDGLLEGVVTRFTAEVNHLALNKDATKLVACSSDFTIKVVDLSSPDSDIRETTFKGHEGPVLSVDFDPLDNFIVSSSCDGTVRIWQISESKEYLAIPVDNFIRLYERNSWSFLRALRCPNLDKPIQDCQFSPDGMTLACVSSDGWLLMWNPEDGTIINRLRDAAFENICNIIWPERTTIYGGDSFGAIGFIAVDDLKSSKKAGLTTPAADEALSPNAIRALMDTDDTDDFANLLSIAAAQAEEQNAATAAATANDDIDDMGSDADSIAISRIKSSYMRLDEEEEEGGDDVNGVADESSQPKTSLPAAQLVPRVPEIKSFQPGAMPTGFRERFMVWNRIGVVTRFAQNDAEDAYNYKTEADSASIEAEFHDTTLLHSLHVMDTVGFTMADLSLTALLLASPGSPEVAPPEESEKDNAVHQSVILLRPLNVRQPGGGEAAAAVGADWFTSLPRGESARAVCLVSDEESRSRGFAVVATSARLLRIFAQPAPSAPSSTSAGLRLLQATSLGLPPISLPGKAVVTMAAHPSLPVLAVVVGWTPEDLYWRVFNLHSPAGGGGPSGWAFGQLSVWSPLPVSPQPRSAFDPDASARLSWFGFSDLGHLVSHDTSGVVRRLVHQNAPGSRVTSEFHWVPVCNTASFIKSSNQKSDCYFVVAVIESADGSSASARADPDSEGDAEADRIQSLRSDNLGYGQVQAIYCKASKWPRVIPRPVVSTLPYRLPLCGVGELDQANLEENYLRVSLAEKPPVWGYCNGYDVDAEALEQLTGKLQVQRKAVLLRLFALAAKLDSDWASLEIANLMPDAETVQLAIRYAARQNRQHLASRLAQVALRKEEGEAEAASVTEEDEDEAEDDEDGDLSEDAKEEDADESSAEEDVEEKENHRKKSKSARSCKDSDSDGGEDTAAEEEGDDEEEEEDAEISTLPSSSLPPTESSMGGTSFTLDDSQQPPSSQGASQRRFNPFRRGGASTKSLLAGGRGSSALDGLKPQAPSVRPALKPLPKNSASKATRRPSSGAKSPTKRASTKASQSGTVKTGGKKRPSSPPITEERVKMTEGAEFSARAAKRLSAFAFSDNA